MRSRKSILILTCLLLAAAAWFLRFHGGGAPSPGNAAANAPQNSAGGIASSNHLSAAKNSAAPSTVKTNKFAYRLTNTAKTIGELAGDRHAILLENAFIDTEVGTALAIPAALKSTGDPGAYIVQARGALDARFRALLASAGAAVVSYIPNNAYLVRVTAAGAGALSASALVQAVLPYEPYYKLQSSLLGLAVEQQPLPAGAALNLGLFASDAAATESALEKLGAKIIATDRSPFGPVVRVLAPGGWTALAQVPGVQLLEPAHQRVLANDLARVTLGISTDTVTNANWLNLSGSNVMVEVNDTGIDTNHPDFSVTGSAEAPGTVPPSRVTGDAPQSLYDTNGHGTHVAGIIAGNGSESYTLTNTPQGSVTNADFRGKAPAATLYSVGGIAGGYDPLAVSDEYLQQAPALTNALISNNSWGYGGDYDYDLAAASYDAATRDALPAQTGSQPVLFVFAAGNDGGGNSDGSGGSADTISSPGTAKNVITVGALEQLRNITNIVTTVTGGVTNQGAVWMPWTDSSSQVAYYSSRGNVGVQTEGTYGRFKPDVVAPGTFVISTRSEQWDTNAYFNPTNVSTVVYPNQIVTTNVLTYYNVTVPPNAVSVTITITSNKYSQPFPGNLPIYVRQAGYPTTNTYDFFTTNDMVSIPNDGGAGYLGQIQNSGFDFAVGDSINQTVHYDLTVAIATTNNTMSDYYQVLFGLNQTLSPWYRYETGTSMAAPAISGVLALIQDYFTNTLGTVGTPLPSPALLKAMLINGSRTVGNYTYALTNGNNFQGWGLASIANSLPLTNNIPIPAGPNTTFNSPLFFVDQNPTNALATGDSHTYLLTISTNDYANYLQLQATLAWTDPPGNPAAAIKLVNSLELVITNLDAPTNIYFGNDITPDLGYNLPWNTNGPPNLDTINNVQNIILPPLLAGNYSVTVVGRAVNVNAVTAQTNNVVQDYALVVSVGEGEVPDAISSVVDNPIVSNGAADQDITLLTTTNSPLLNQFVGANAPLLNTNTVSLGGTNQAVTLGLTNQWHFYMITNNALDDSGSSSDVTNAAFVTFSPNTLSIPRNGVFADSAADSTRPEADIDVYVTTDYNLTNLSPVTISNCVNGTQVGASAGGVFNGASLGQGGTEFVADTNSTPGEVYYVGVKSEDQMASEYDFLSVFTAKPFSQTGPNGTEIVNGLLLPVSIPDGSPAHPGAALVFALALQPMTVDNVTVSNQVWHQNFGDLFGALSHSEKSVVLNNHDGFGNTYSNAPVVYDDSGSGQIPSAHPSDGPGSLRNFTGTQGVGPWILTEEDNSLGYTGVVESLTLMLQPHQDLSKGITVTIPPFAWFYDYVDVPAGYMTLNINATNTTQPYGTLPVAMYERFGAQPTFGVYDQEADLTNCLGGLAFDNGGSFPGAGISTGPPLPVGFYYVGLYNSNNVQQTVYLVANLVPAPVVGSYVTNGPALVIPDDAVTSSSIFVSSTQQIASLNVGMVVKHPRISDLSFTLISPTGQRILLMENRGGLTTNGAGNIYITTNNFAPVTANGGGLPQTNFLNLNETSGQLTITYNMYQVPDEMTVYYGTNNLNTNSSSLLYDTGFVSGTGTITVSFGPGTSTYLTIIMNQFGNKAGPSGTAWTYTAGGVQTNLDYFTFTDDTNLTTIPVKFAIPPFDKSDQGTNYNLCDFELATNGDYFALTTNLFDPFGGWTLPTNLVTYSSVFNLSSNAFQTVTNITLLTNNEVTVMADPVTASGGSNFLALAGGVMTRTVQVIPGRLYTLGYSYRGPGIGGWWRGEGNASDSSSPEYYGNNGALIGRFDFPAGEVGQAFEMENSGQTYDFAGTNGYVQIRQPPFLILVNTNSDPENTNLSIVQSSSLDVGTGGGLTVEGWINPTNVLFQQPLVEWLARVPTNGSDTNLVIEAGPFLNPGTGHYYYMLRNTNWLTSETWATQIGGHLATVDTANEQNWIFDTFASYGGTNRNLWIGMTNVLGTKFGYIGGLTNVTYTNWLNGQPLNTDSARTYTMMFGATNVQAGLWALANNNGFLYGSTVTNKIYGVVEVNDLQTNGVQFWISVTNIPGTTNTIVSSNGCLYANLVDTTNGSHIIFSAPGLIQSNVFQHVALTYNTNSGIANLYYDGTNVASTNFGGTVFVPKTTGDVLLGKDMSRLTNNYYGGLMDEMSIYRRALSDAEIQAIYNVSAFSTNRSVGKFDPSITPALGLAEAQVTLQTVGTNLALGDNINWQQQGFSFIPTTNLLQLQVSGIEPGMLLDSFSLSEAALGNLYYQPEQSLDAVDGQSAYGTWTLEIWDSRTGGVATNAQLVSWQLDFTVQTNPAVTLNPEGQVTNTVPPNSITYFAISVPTWATSATNVLVSATLPVDLFFNQTNEPAGANPGDYIFLTNSTGGTGAFYAMTTNAATPPPLLPGQTYYLGVRNNNPVSSTVVLRVDFNITVLTNGVPFTGVLNTNATDAGIVERYFAFDVTNSSAYEATFQLLNLSNNADLVVSKGAPLPTLTSAAYGSFSVTNFGEAIYVLTNSAPVPLSAGRWYLGVIPRDSVPIRYTVLAKELDVTGGSVTNSFTVIPLTNGVPVNFTAGPGAALTNFFVFTVTNPVVNGVTNFVPGLRFELYNLSGNGDLTVQTSTPPLAPPFFQSSQNPRRNDEFILIQTNSALTNLAANWYLGVPNNESNLISYTIVAEILTNGYFPAFPGASGVGGGAEGAGHADVSYGKVYHVTTNSDSGPGTLRDAVSSTNRTVVFDISGTINLTAPLIITNSYLTIAGQTAPGGGITVAGNMTTLQSAHDVIIRDLRFRPPETAWFNGFEGNGNANYSPTAGNYFAGGWHIDSGDLDVLVNGTFGSTAYEGTHYIDINGNNPATISTNVFTVPGQNYTLGFAYSRNPDGGSPDVVQLLVNNNSLLNLNVAINSSWANLKWAKTSVVFTATAPTTQIQFALQTPGAYGVLLDAVSLTANVNMDDPLRFTNVMNIIADHVSASWSSNNLVSVLNSTNVTVQWSILSDSLYDTNNPHGFGSRLRYGSGALSFHHNLYADNYNGSPRLGDNISLDFVNNVIYNWGLQPGFTSTNTDLADNIAGFTNQLNYACNYLIAGADTAVFATNLNITNIAFVGGTTNTWIYQTNNFIDSDTNGFLNGANTQWGMFTNQYTKSGHPFPLLPVPTDEAFLAYEKVLDFAGPDMAQRDSVDTSIVGKVRTQTGRLISTAGTPSTPVSAPPYLDTDQDGIPDFWEMTFTPTNVYVPSNNNDRDGDGYTDLEEYNNWLAGPHALTVTTNPVSVDLKQLFGQTGNLSFCVTNGVKGFAYVTNVIGTVTNTGTWSNSIAVFTPTNNLNAATNYSGYASFDVYVTNNDTVAWFGPVTVSVVASAVSVVTNNNFPPNIITLTNATPYYASTNYGGSDYYRFTVPTNAYAALFDVTNASGPVTLVARYGLPLPSLSTYDYITNNAALAEEHIVVLTNSTPVPLTNGDWYLAVVNVSGSNVTYTVAASYLLSSVVPPVFSSPTNGSFFTNLETTPFTTNCLATDSNTPPLPLTFALVSGPSGLTVSAGGTINWTPTEAQGPSTNTVYVSVANAAYSVTNSFTIIVEESNLPPVLPSIPNLVVIVPNVLVVTNTATDADIPANPLTYSVLVAPPNAAIDTNGVITWPSTNGVAGSNYLFTTVVTDTNQWAVNAKSLSATNSFTVTVLPGVTGGAPQTNTVPAGGINWLAVSVPTNAVAATNILLYATNLPVNVWFSTNTPPTITNSSDYELLVNLTNGVSALATNSSPAKIVPGKTYFLGVQNTNGVAVTYGIQVNFLLAIPVSTQTNTVSISSVTYQNAGGTNGFLLVWYAPSNDLFQVQWTADLAPASWITFTNIVSYNTNAFTSPTNTQFNFLDDGSQSGGPGAVRFYRLVLLQAANSLTLPVQANQIVGVSAKISVTNAAADSRNNAVLSYALVNPPAGAAISTNGVIIWTNAVPSGIAARFNTVVTDDSAPPLTASNSFTVFVSPFPSITNVTVTAANVALQWAAPTNDQFQVQWTTNLVPVVNWTLFPNVITSTNGVFLFTDTNAPLLMKFYELILLP
jgi:subtilisin-like proprotein convertase family protein